MKTTRNALLAGAMALAIAGGFAPAPATARDQAHAHGSQDRPHAGKHRAGKAHGETRRAKASAHRAERGRQDGAFADSRPAPASRQALHRAGDRRARARASALRDARAHQVVVRQQHADHERREAERHAHARDDRRALGERQRLAAQQRHRAAEYDRYLASRRAADARRIAALRQQRRLQQYRYQQWYWQQQQARRQRWLAQRDVYAPVSYRYVRDGRTYAVNRFAADLLQQAIRDGYQMGARAGNADRMDGWRNDWRGNLAYLDASYGYDAGYVDRDEYAYYFRQGFRRGYEDAYGNDYRYGAYRGGRNDGGIATILASVLQGILGLQPY